MNDRKERSLYQNLYIIEAKPTDDEYTRQFAVMGSTGNVYTVTIKANPTCTCPDYILRKRRCKHVFFILIRAMKCLNEDKKKYSKDELKKMFKNIPKIASNLMVDDELTLIYKSSTTDGIQKDNEGKVQKRGAEDTCPICLDELTQGEIDWCKYSCGKCVHTKCFEMYVKKNSAKCVFCRAEWQPKKKSISKKKGYINLLKDEIEEEEEKNYYRYKRYNRSYRYRRRFDDNEEGEEVDDDIEEDDELY